MVGVSSGIATLWGGQSRAPGVSKVAFGATLLPLSHNSEYRPRLRRSSTILYGGTMGPDFWGASFMTFFPFLPWAEVSSPETPSGGAKNLSNTQQKAGCIEKQGRLWESPLMDEYSHIGCGQGGAKKGRLGGLSNKELLWNQEVVHKGRRWVSLGEWELVL